jgi:tetratricopeptide (TPR) repeat protein
METGDPPPSAFDELLDLRFRGAEVDPDAFLAAHPEISDAERDQIRRFCRSRAADEPSSPTEAAAPVEAGATAPPIARLGSYRLGRRLGAGGMGAVFLAQDESLGRPVAVKVLGPDLLGTGERSERFLREARAVARLRHPNVVEVYAAGEQDGFRYMAMEFVPGANLHDLISEATGRGTRLAVADVIRWGIEIARALQAAHDANIVHRDVKPSNIRITEDGRAVLLDFGLVLEADAATLTLSGGFRGSPQYASPEQVGVMGVPIDARTDGYSLGATLYEALTGVAPFRGETREQLFNHILTREPVAPRRLDPSISRDLETVVLAALEKDPARRYATAAALAADLEALRDGQPISARPPSAAGRVIRWARRQPVKAALAATAVAGVLAAAVLGGFVAANLPKIRKATADELASRVAGIVTEGFLEYGEGDAERAQTLFEEALRIDRTSPEAQAGYALSLTDRGQHAAAIAFLDEVHPANSSGAWPNNVRRMARERAGFGAESKSHGETSQTIDHFVIGMMHLNRAHSGFKEAAALAYDHLHRAVLSAPRAIPIYHYELGHAAWHAGRHADAIRIADSIARLRPDSPDGEFAIGRTLLAARRDEALDRLEKLAHDPPHSLQRRTFIIVELAQSGRGGETLEAALELARNTVALDPSRARSRVALGAAHLVKRDLDAALTAAREAVRLEPGLAMGQRLLGQTLSMKGLLEEALPPAREAAHLDPKDSRAWNVLGAALMGLDRYEESLAAYEEGLKLDADDAATLCNAGKLLCQLGRFEEGLERLRKGHEKGSKLAGWSNPSQRMVADAERLVALERRLVEARKGEGDPLAPEHRTMLAWAVCRPKKLFAEAARLYANAFHDDPVLLSQRPPDHALCAAIMSVSAGLGQGQDAPADAAERARLRNQARSWLEDEAAAMTELLRRDPSAAEPIRLRVKAWIAEPALGAVRSPKEGGALTAGEVAAWQTLWARCDGLSR